MLNNLRKRLANALYPVDIVALTREKLKGVSTADYYENLDEEDKRHFEEQAMQAYKNKALDKITDCLIQAQIQYAVRQTEDLNQLFFARATINGLSLLREELARLNSLYEEHNKPNEGFDLYDVL